MSFEHFSKYLCSLVILSAIDPLSISDSLYLKGVRRVRTILSEGSLYTDLVYHVTNTLETIRKIIEDSPGKFRDKGFEEFFYKTVSEKISENEILLKSYHRFFFLTSLLPRRGTLNSIVENSMRKYKSRFEKKEIATVRELDEELPDVVIPDEHLEFAIDLLLQYVLLTTSAHGSFSLLAKARCVPQDKITAPITTRNWIEIEARTKSILPVLEKERVFDFLLHLIHRIVEKNYGILEFEADETRRKRSVFLKFPQERRKRI
jgi:hypothetical protein